MSQLQQCTSASCLDIDRQTIEEGDELLVEEREASLARVIRDDTIVTTHVTRANALQLHL